MKNIALNNRGYSLLEIMIAVLVIGLIVAIAIPSILRARILANEKKAIKHLQAISIAVESYHAANGATYPDEVDDLVISTPPYLAELFAGLTNGSGSPLIHVSSGFGGSPGWRGDLTDTISGYSFWYYLYSGGETYAIRAFPEELDVTGIHSFCITPEGAIYEKTTTTTGISQGLSSGFTSDCTEGEIIVP